METYLPTLTVAGVLAFIAPLLSTAIYKLTWSSKAKQLTAIAVSIVVAVFALLVTDGFTPPNAETNIVTYIGTLILAVIGVGQLAYGLVWKGSTADAKIATVTSSEAERKAFIEKNTIAGEVVKEDVQAVPDIVQDSVSPTPARLTDGPDHRLE